MSIGIIKKFLRGDEQTLNNAFNLSTNLINWKWLKQHPDVLAAYYGAGALSLGAGIAGMASTAMPENQGLQVASEVGTALNPFADSAAEFIMNKHVAGMGNAEAGYKAGLSGVGQVGGQYLARKFLPQDEEGNQNQLGILLSGMGGEVVTDAVAELSYPVAKGFGNRFTPKESEYEIQRKKNLAEIELELDKIEKAKQFKVAQEMEIGRLNDLYKKQQAASRVVDATNAAKALV